METVLFRTSENDVVLYCCVSKSGGQWPDFLGSVGLSAGAAGCFAACAGVSLGISAGASGCAAGVGGSFGLSAGTAGCAACAGVALGCSAGAAGCAAGAGMALGCSVGAAGCAAGKVPSSFSAGAAGCDAGVVDGSRPGAGLGLELSFGTSARAAAPRSGCCKGLPGSCCASAGAVLLGSGCVVRLGCRPDPAADLPDAG